MRALSESLYICITISDWACNELLNELAASARGGIYTVMQIMQTCVCVCVRVSVCGCIRVCIL